PVAGVQASTGGTWIVGFRFNGRRNGGSILSGPCVPTPLMNTPLSVSRARLALILAGLAMFGPFSIDTVFPAFPVMASDLGASKLAMQQTISTYLIGYAAMSLFHGPISDAIGRKKVLVAGTVLFTLASAGAALAQDMPTMLAFRVLQGLSAGVGLIVGRAVIRDCLQGDDAQRLMSHVSMIFGVAPAIAPIIGGWILDRKSVVEAESVRLSGGRLRGLYR